MKSNEYEILEKPLSEEFTKLLISFAKMANNKDEENMFIIMAREIWNISYFDECAQAEEIGIFVSSLNKDEQEQKKFINLMIKGIADKKKATQYIDIKDVWTRVENLKVLKTQSNYVVEFELDFYQ